jgi:hypothetical protein
LRARFLGNNDDVVSRDKLVRTDEDNFRPEYSIARAKIRYVDANLAIRFADASQDVNIMLGFLTLFLGSAISFSVSFLTSEIPNNVVLLATATAFSILMSVIFSILTVRSWIKAETTKKLLFESGDLNPHIRDIKIA